MQDKKQSLVPELRFPGFEGDWEVKSLGEIGSTYAGLSGKSKEDFVNGNAQYITFLNVLNNVVIDNTNHPTVKIKENENQNDVKYGDLLFNTSSETPEEVGFCAMMQDNKPNIYLNSFCFGYRFNVLKDYQPLFLAYYFRSSYGRRLMTKLAQGVTRYNLSKSNFLKAEIAFPSLPEQQKIAECLSSVDDLIQAEADQLQALKDHKKGLMQQLFPQDRETTPKLRFPGFEGEWEEKKLGAFGPIVTGSTPSRQNTLYWNGNFCWVSAQDMKEKYIYDTKEKVTEDGMKRCRLLPKNSVLVTCIASIGLNSITKVECATNQQINAIIAKNELEAEFIYQSMERYTPLLKALAGQTAVPIVNKQQFCDFEIPTPPSLPEQQKIAECLSSLDEGIAAQQRKVEALKEHKKGLMQKLFPNNQVIGL